jgi:hypothetical protein
MKKSKKLPQWKINNREIAKRRQHRQELIEELDELVEAFGGDGPSHFKQIDRETVSFNTAQFYARYLSETIKKSIDPDKDIPTHIKVLDLDQFNRLVIQAEMHVPMYDDKHPKL